MSWLWVFWWAFDDNLAAAIGVPGLGHVPFWVVLLISICASCGDSSIARLAAEKVKGE